MADKGGIQLLPESRKKIEVSVPGENKLLTIGSVILVLVLIIWGGIIWYKGYLKNTVNTIDSNLQALEGKRDKKMEQTLATFQKQTDLISRMLANHLYWTEGFARVESMIHPQIQFETFTASAEEGSLDFRATAPNYTVIAKQIASFSASDKIEDVNLSSVNTLTNGRLQFSMKIDFKSDVFLSKTAPKTK